MSWLVTWTVVTMLLIPCSNQEMPTPNEYGVVNPPIVSMTLKSCWEAKRATNSRAFSTEDEAIAFVEKGKKMYEWQFHTRLEDFKIYKVDSR